MWRLYDQNCSTVVYKALCAGGALVRLPSTTADVYRTLPVWYPRAVEAFVNDFNAMATVYHTAIDAKELSSFLSSYYDDSSKAE